MLHEHQRVGLDLDLTLLLALPSSPSHPIPSHSTLREVVGNDAPSGSSETSVVDDGSEVFASSCSHGSCSNVASSAIYDDAPPCSSQSCSIIASSLALSIISSD